jgi:hypothetical protein
VAFYERALTHSEIAQHHSRGLAGNGYCDETPVAPTIVSVPLIEATVDQLYEYDVDASGYPTPTYALLSAPAGMGIDGATGEITWIPDAVGDFEVTVEAGNTAGTDEQSFTITVVSPLPCPAEIAHYWRLDEAVAPYVDFWGTADGVCSNCPSQTGGLVDEAQWFDGADDEVDVPDDDTFDWSAEASFTMAFWMQTDQSTSGNRVVLGRDDSGTNLHWWLGPNGSGYALFQLRDVNGNGIALVDDGLAQQKLNDGAWHLVVAVRKGDVDSNYVYVDGGLKKEGYHDYTAGFGSGVPMNVGYLNLSGHYRYHGALDEVALFDRALPEVEIAQMYADGLAGYGYCDDAPTAPGLRETVKEILPERCYLAPNRANPFHSSTTIRFGLTEETHVELAIFNIQGQKIRTLVSNRCPAGHHSVVWDGRNGGGAMVSSGVYFYRMATPRFMKIRKMIMIR